MNRKVLVVYSGTRGGGVNDYKNLVKSGSFDGFSIFNFGAGEYLVEEAPKRLISYFFLYLQLLIILVSKIKNYDGVIFVMCSPFNFFMPILRIINHKKCQLIYCCHNTLDFQDNVSNFRDKLTKFMEIVGRLSADKLFFFSENVFRGSAKFWQKRSVVIGFGYTTLECPVAPRIDSIPADGTYWLFFGRATRYKGLDTICNCLKFLSPSTKILIACSGAKGAEISILNGHENVTVLDRWLSDEELHYLLKHSKGILLPYTDVTQSGPLYLAIGHSKAVIASDIDEFKNISLKMGSMALFSAGDPHDLAYTLNALSEVERGLLERNAKQNKEKFSWKAVANRIVRNI